MKAYVDRDLCQGHGQCEQEAPEIFEVRDDGYAYVLRDFEASELPLVRSAAARCPIDAVSFTE